MLKRIALVLLSACALLTVAGPADAGIGGTSDGPPPATDAHPPRCC